ncbi:MAG: hypothetical protein ABS81_05640 [Pseudonocardia sp. SCN 72-86]|mgnify:CR=1 FL=1|nr:MAG: hypothetical protein ABS81_05640 [Pseudonocardia sp. SCN 72-86]
MNEPHIGIVIGTTRQERLEAAPARWIDSLAAGRRDLKAEIVDLRDYPLPFWDEPVHSSVATKTKETIRRWCDKIASLDGYIFVTAEYNQSFSATLKNALEFPHLEFSKKPAAFVGCGDAGGARAIQHLRQVVIELEIAPLRSAVLVGLDDYFVADGEKSLSDFDHLRGAGNRLLDEMSWWSATLKTGRTNGRASAPSRLAEFRRLNHLRQAAGDAAAL